jgi:hypothetical protein
MSDVDNISDREARILLAHFLHYLPQSDVEGARGISRNTIGREYPGIYNRLCGREIVVTTWPHEREKLEAELDGLRRFQQRVIDERARAALDERDPS